MGTTTPGTPTGSAGAATTSTGTTGTYAAATGGTYPAGATGTTAPPTASPAGGTYPAAPTPAPTAPVEPPAPRVKGAGPAAFGVVVALGLLLAAGFLLAERTGSLAGPWLLLAAGAWIVVLGLAIIVAGARGRSSGGVGFLAVVALILTVPVATAYNVGGSLHGWNWGAGPVVAVGERDLQPRTVDEAERGVRIGAGDVTLDLTEVPLIPGRTVEVPVNIGAGDVDLIVPADAAVEVEVYVGAGQARSELDRPRETSGLGVREVFRSDSVRAGEQPELLVRVGAMAGDVTVEVE